ELREVVQLETVGVDTCEPLAMERRPLDRVCQQGPKAGALVCLDLAPAPAEARDVVGHAGEEVRLQRLAKRRERHRATLLSRAPPRSPGGPRPSPPSTICESAGQGNAPGSAARSRVTPAPTARMSSAIERGAIAGSRPPRRWSRSSTAASRSTVRAWASA